MSVYEIFADASAAGIEFAVSGDALRFYPRNAMTSGLLARVKRHKPEIMRRLNGEVSTPIDDDDWCDVDAAVVDSLNHWDDRAAHSRACECGSLLFRWDLNG